MKNDIKNINYNLTKAQELRQKEKQYKLLLIQLKKDIKYILYRVLKNKNSYDILNNKENIITQIYREIRTLTDEKETIKYNNNLKNINVKYTIYRYDEIDDIIIYDNIEEMFFKIYKQVKAEEKELLDQRNNKYIKIIYNKLEYYYFYLRKDKNNYKNIIYSINNLKYEIIDEIEKENDIKIEIDLFNKAFKLLKDNYKDDIDFITNNNINKNKLNIFWKIYFILFGIEKANKYLK